MFPFSRELGERERERERERVRKGIHGRFEGERVRLRKVADGRLGSGERETERGGEREGGRGRAKVILGSNIYLEK